MRKFGQKCHVHALFTIFGTFDSIAKPFFSSLLLLTLKRLLFSPKNRPELCRTLVWHAIKNFVTKFRCERTNAADLWATSIYLRRRTPNRPSWRTSKRARNHWMNSSLNHVIEWVSSIKTMRITAIHRMLIEAPKTATSSRCFTLNVTHLIWMTWASAKPPVLIWPMSHRRWMKYSRKSNWWARSMTTATCSSSMIQPRTNCEHELTCQHVNQRPRLAKSIQSASAYRRDYFGFVKIICYFCKALIKLRLIYRIFDLTEMFIYIFGMQRHAINMREISKFTV